MKTNALALLSTVSLVPGFVTRDIVDSRIKLLEKLILYIMYKLVLIYCMYFSNALYLQSQN